MTQKSTRSRQAMKSTPEQSVATALASSYQRGNRATIRDIKKSIRAHGHVPEAVSAALASLVERGAVTAFCKPLGGRGRPTIFYSLARAFTIRTHHDGSRVVEFGDDPLPYPASFEGLVPVDATPPAPAPAPAPAPDPAPDPAPAPAPDPAPEAEHEAEHEAEQDLDLGDVDSERHITSPEPLESDLQPESSPAAPPTPAAPAPTPSAAQEPAQSPTSLPLPGTHARSFEAFPHIRECVKRSISERGHGPRKAEITRYLSHFGFEEEEAKKAVVDMCNFAAEAFLEGGLQLLPPSNPNNRTDHRIYVLRTAANALPEPEAIWWAEQARTRAEDAANDDGTPTVQA
jgi:hypothetical protein